MGVMLHESCLTTMIVSANPFVAFAPIIADVIENAFCLWSLHHAITALKQKRSSRVAPASEMGSIGERMTMTSSIGERMTMTSELSFIAETNTMTSGLSSIMEEELSDSSEECFGKKKVPEQTVSFVKGFSDSYSDDDEEDKTSFVKKQHSIVRGFSDSYSDDDEEEEERNYLEKMTTSEVRRNMGMREKRSLVKRSSNMYSLIWDLKNTAPTDDDDDENASGTSLFIAATLLQRELVELIVPVQAALVLSVLYIRDLKSNSLVSNWNSEDYTRAMAYLGIDFVVEIIVFMLTILLLKRIQPEFSAFRILMGLVSTNLNLMIINTLLVWYFVLMFQSTLTGADMTMKFKWLNCDTENATWLGGYHWEGC